MDPPTLSTFELRQAAAYKKQGFSVLGKVNVPVLPLRDVLHKYVKHTVVDFMSIDVEGMEMQVLESNDWKKYRPHFICIEAADYSQTKKGAENYEHIQAFLIKAGYRKVYDNGLNAFYKDTFYE